MPFQGHEQLPIADLPELYDIITHGSEHGPIRRERHLLRNGASGHTIEEEVAMQKMKISDLPKARMR